MARRGARVPGFWTQRLYGSGEEILGPAHGLTGVVAALAAARSCSAGRLVPATAAALSATAVREGELRELAARAHDAARASRAAPSARSGATAPPASWPRWPRSRATTSSTPAARGRRADLGRGSAAQGREPLPRDRRQRLRAAQALHPHRRRALARAGAALRDALRRQVAAARRQYGRGRYSLWTGDIGTAVYLQQCLAAARRCRPSTCGERREGSRATTPPVGLSSSRD